MTRRDMGVGALALLTASLAGEAAASSEAGGAQDLYSFVHPELRAAARQLQELSRAAPPFSDGILGAARQGAARYARTPLASVPFAKRLVPASKGSPGVIVYVINAKPGTSRPGILHMHGGGYFMGMAEHAIGSLQEIAAALDCAIVSVEYRLAPETSYVGSTEDNYAGLRWLHHQAAELGVDRARLAVMGESAGAGHAALLAIAARDRGEVPLAFQCLVYPMLDDRTGSSRRVPSPIGTILWTEEANRYGWRSFLGQEPGGIDVPAAAVPARVSELAGLPPAFISVGSIDLFVQEDIEYARRLIEAGVTTELLVVPGAFHGFDLFAPDTAVAKNFAAVKMAALKHALG